MKKTYVLFLIAYLFIYEFFDTYCTSYYTAVVSYIQADFKIDHSQWYMVMALASLGMFLAMFSQLFADVFGRKLMMITVFFGMGLSSLIMYLSQSKVQFIAGFFLLWVFFSSDIWVIVVSEESPKEKRARYASLVLVFGSLGGIAIPFLRGLFIHSLPSDDPTLWRTMTYLAILALPLSLLGFFMKETQAFAIQKSESGQFNLKKALAMVKQPFILVPKSIMLVFLIIGVVSGMLMGAYSTLEAYLTKMIGNTRIINNTLTAAAIGTLIFFVTTGLLADKWGRKQVFCYCFGLNFISSLLFILMMPSLTAAKNYIPIYIITIIAYGSYWGLLFLSKIHCLECFPTEIRGTSAGLRSLSFAFGLTSGSLLCSALSTVMSLDEIYVLFSGIAVLIIPFLVIKFLPETKGIKITGA